MSNKIAKKLMLYFALALLVFSLITGTLFAFLFRNYTIDHNIADMERRAQKIADTLGDFMQNGVNINSFGGHGHGGEADAEHVQGDGKGMGGFGAYMRFMPDFAMGDVWVVNPERELLTQGEQNPTYATLPDGAEQLIEQAFAGNMVHGENFSPMLENMLTVAVPIRPASEVLGVVLLHSPMNGMDAAIMDGFRLLAISTVCALAVAALISWLLSRKFTDPLRKITAAAEKIKREDYLARTGVDQADEIGLLANTIDELSGRLREASLESQKYEQLRRDFMSNVSHELRTPVTVLRGSVEALRDGVVTDGEKIAEYYDSMLGECLHMQRLVNDLLELSRLQNPDFCIEKSRLELRELLADASNSVERLAQKKGIAVNTELPEEPCPFDGDYSRLKQMLLIVGDNAVKFTPNGGSVDIVLRRRGEYYEIAVSDSGCGIAAAELPNIFDRFHKGNSSQNGEGTGLGLAIARHIAGRHDISISVQSEQGSGTRVIFSAPVPLDKR